MGALPDNETGHGRSASQEQATDFRAVLGAAALTALGIVYGDIGTSPLYAFKVAVQAAGGNVAVSAVGVASLIIWSLVLVVSIKYAALILRADNHG